MDNFTNELYSSERLGRWLLQSLSEDNPELSIPELLKFLAEVYSCERTYIFEIDYNRSTFSNTYEWCAEGVVPQKDNLQDEDLELVTPWLEMFEKKLPVIIRQLEDIKNAHPSVYATLKVQHIDSLISVPIYRGNELIGFLGIDNPKESVEDEMVPLLNKMGKLFAYILHTRNLVYNIEFLEYHDQLTLTFNRNAMERDLEEHGDTWKKLGVLSCDISELKATNDVKGYNAGDTLICQCSAILQEIFAGYNVYRSSGDKFLILCPEIEEGEFEEKVSMLEAFVESTQNFIAYGVAWTDDEDLAPQELIQEAEIKVHENKAIYFNEIDPLSGKSRDRRILKTKAITDYLDDVQPNLLYHFIENNYFSLDVFFQSMSVGEHHPYMGDLTKNSWYLSDSMKEVWGFENNIVYDLLVKWEEFIPYKEDLELYRNDIKEMIEFKKNVHDLIYRITDKSGEEFWIRCFGLMKWNEDRSAPVFFCGNVSKLSNAFVVDPITNFPREKAAIREIGKILHSEKQADFLCFRLNGFSEINEIRGRNIANNLLKDISVEILKSFDESVQCYRLDGLRFLMIVDQESAYNKEEISRRIRTLTSDLYSEYNLPIRFPCSIGVINEINKNMSAQEIMTDIISVLEIAKNSPETNIVYSTQTVRMHRAQKQIVMEISRDVANNMENFRVVIQPIVSAKTGQIVAGELLIRWKHDGKDVSPMVFIPILEENDLIHIVGRWIFDQAARHCKRISSYIPNFFMDFNVSYYQINDEGLVDFMKATLDKYALDGKQLVMELTETHYNDDPVKLQEFIEAGKRLGMRMALDDFGVGYSSLEMLLKYPANVVKLDRSLMKKMSDSEESSDFITTIVYACHKFGKIVCVEGVETEKELKIVRDAGCDMIQGYYFYKPLEIASVYDVLIEL